ncbi:restriction endonuclease subunit S [Georgenia thermotolerans]|uniref:Type I restriction modification DNA specificity domain-containing protein n=1 Tax=Georgenia thermotolerans TaxID=527326 RepID=A0A7J5USG6_9MICO|nr:restriction endonuclease subunit S [Georgenia thermotolerans]KAE8765346.1 hypothetical protein GB883_04075 [Georgenia thermotolerans]
MFQNLKPYPAYSGAGLPWLDRYPSHWDKRRFKQVLRSVDSRSTTGEEELLTVSSARGVVPRSSQAVTMFKAASYVGHKLASPGDLVINSLWAWGRGLGVSRHFGIVSTAYGVYRQVEPGLVDPDYLHFYVRSEPYNWELRERSRGIWISRLQLTDDRFLTSPFVAPPIEEQRAIVTYLSHAHQRINRAIAAKQSLIKLLREQEEAIIRETISRGVSAAKVKESGLGWLRVIPEHWSVVALRYLATLGNGSTPARSNPAYWTDGSFPWLNSAVVNQGVVRKSDQFVTDIALAECHLPIVAPGSVLVGITGQGRTRGMAALLEVPATVNQHLAYMTPDRSQLVSDYLLLVLKAAYGELRRISSDSGSTKGALTVADLKAFRIPLPPIEEQFAVARAVERQVAATRSLSARAEQEIALLVEFRTRLESEVVTGQVDVREVAAALQPLDEAEVVAGLDQAPMEGDDEIVVEDVMEDA